MKKEMEKVEKMARLLHSGHYETTTHAVGGGEWSLEVSGEDLQGNMVWFELVGSNGTHYPADDLWGQLDEIMKEANLL